VERGRIARGDEALLSAEQDHADLTLVGVGDERRRVRVVDRIDAPLDAGADVRPPVVSHGERNEVRVFAAKQFLRAPVGVEARERSFAGFGSRGGHGGRGRRAARASLRDVGQLGVLVRDRVRRIARAEGDRFHVFAGKIVEHRRATGAGDPVEDRLAARAGVEHAIGGERERHDVGLVAFEIHLRFSRGVDAEDLAVRPSRGEKRILLGVEGERPHVIGALQVDELRRLVRLDPKHAPVRDRRGEDSLAECGDERRHGELPRVRPRRDLRPRDAEDLARVARTEQNTAPRLYERAPDRRRLAERQRAEVEPGAHAAERVDRRPFEIAARKLVERVELERARSHGERGRHHGDERREGQREGQSGRFHFGGRVYLSTGRMRTRTWSLPSSRR
jgi:hypothetical protein